MLRLWALGMHSLLVDEASVAIGARDMLRNHTPMWDAISNAPFVWMVAHLIGLKGLDSDFLVRLPAALFGILSIPLVYWLAKRLFNYPIAIVSALFFAIHPFAIAFNRVLFADTFQLFFILAGIIAFDFFGTSSRSRGALLLAIFLLWGAAFLMKYNAIVPAALWLVSGVVTRRYSLRSSLFAFLAMAFGSFATLLPWPYNAPIWLFAFIGKGGTYSITNAVHFFWIKLHLILFTATEVTLVAGCVLSFLKVPWRKPIFQITLFLLLYLITISILGRSFERYLLMIVPFAGMLFIAVLASIPGRGALRRWMFAFMENRDVPISRREQIGALAGTLYLCLLLAGIIQAYSNYYDYLRNDYDHEAVARIAKSLESNNHRGFWLLPESMGGYYLGFSQLYSRTLYPCCDTGLGERNYFEWESIPYCQHPEGLGIFEIRRMARRWGIWHIIASPFRFRDSAEAIANAARHLPQPPALDYLTSDSIHPGDILVMQCGFTNLQEEPILENISHEGGPPYLSSLPLGRFRILKVFRPEGIAPNTDTTITRVRAGAWLMARK